jgi:hypothetical protein
MGYKNAPMGLPWEQRSERHPEMRSGETLAQAFARVVEERNRYATLWERWQQQSERNCQAAVDYLDDRDAAFSLAVEEEQRANEGWQCVAFLLDCLTESETECQELRKANEFLNSSARHEYEAVAELRETLVRERKVFWALAEEMWAVRGAAADYHAAWQDAASNDYKLRFEWSEKYAADLTCRLNEAVRFLDKYRQERDELRAELSAVRTDRDNLLRERDALGERLCQFHDTNPLNEVVAQLEGERDIAIEGVERLKLERILLENERDSMERARDYWRQEYSCLMREPF